MFLFLCLSLFCITVGKRLTECNCPVHFFDLNIPGNMCTEKIILLMTAQSVDIVPSSVFPDSKDGEIRYTINILDILQGKELLENVDLTHLFALRDYMVCGPRVLERNLSYFISVLVYEDKMYIDRCSVMAPADYVTDKQRRVMEGKIKCPAVSHVIN